MKFRSREINVFNMSALDLFASALGAFILISIVLMPYFLRVDPEEEARLRQALAEARASGAETRERLGQARGALEQARSGNAQLQRRLQELIDAPKFQFPDLDIVIALDTTGSMRRQVDGLRSEIVQLTRLLLKLSPSLAVGVIDFKDRCEGTAAVREFPLRRMNAAGLDTLSSFTGTMSAGSLPCNRDGPEALARALDTAIASNWRAESESRTIVIITDNPAYEERKAHALAAARAFAASGPQSRVSVVLRGNDEDFLRSLATAGNGEYVRAGASFTAAIVLALAS